MTNRLTPVCSCRGAEAWWGFDMVVEIIEDDRVDDIATGG